MPFKFSDIQGVTPQFKYDPGADVSNVFMDALRVRQQQQQAKMQDDRMRAQQAQDAHQFGERMGQSRDNESARRNEWAQEFGRIGEQQKFAQGRATRQDDEAERQAGAKHMQMLAEARQMEDPMLVAGLSRLAPPGAPTGGMAPPAGANQQSLQQLPPMPQNQMQMPQFGVSPFNFRRVP